MASDLLTQQLLALPLSERVALAEALWQSINQELEADPQAEERAAVQQALARAAELDSGAVAGRTHEQVMDAARRVLECR
jgi:putative addiction module component (TIGR02574 family)